MENISDTNPLTASDQGVVQGSELCSRLIREIQKQIVGQHSLLERLVVALLADGHVLLEGVPGLAKTRTLQALTTCIDAQMKRVQFTQDLLPSDLVGTEVFRPELSTFEIRKGPVFTNLLLADEINRAPAKVQSALLQAMQEREVTIGQETFVLPQPFMVLATQNPIEQEGTYPLPEAQLDRFLMKVKVSYPTMEEELEILKIPDANTKRAAELEPVMHLAELASLREGVKAVYIDPKIDRYIVSLIQATRTAENYGLAGLIEWGASPRASLALRRCAQCLAFIRGKKFVTPDHVKELAPEVLRHRILLTFEAEARGVDADEIVRILLNSVAIP